MALGGPKATKTIETPKKRRFFASLDIDVGLEPRLQAKIGYPLPDPPDNIVGRRDIGGDDFIGEELSDDIMGNPADMPVDAHLLRASSLQPAHAQVFSGDEAGPSSSLIRPMQNRKGSEF